jgi:hypothetical protein
MLLGVSESGYTNDSLALAWIKHFDKWSKKRQQGTWRLLVFDGHESHLTHDFINYCWEAQIIPINIPSHLSHILQPLDVVCFQPYKYHHKATVEVAVREGCEQFNKVEFLHAIKKIRKATFKINTIQSSWKKSGLWPIDSEVVLSKLKTVDRPASPLADDAASNRSGSPPTPINAFEIAEFARRDLQDVNPETGDIEPLLSRITKLAKAGVAAAAALELATEELQRVQAASQKRARRQEPGRKVVQYGGVVSVGDARLHVAKRCALELEAEERVAKRAAAKAKKPQVPRPLRSKLPKKTSLTENSSLS